MNRLINESRNEANILKKLNVCVLFGGVSPEHEVSLRSAEFVLSSLDPEKYNIFPVGITRKGDWILYAGKDYSAIPADKWLDCEENRRATISPIKGQGLLTFEGDCVVRELIDVVFPVLHGENGEDGAMQGLLQLSGIPFVGSHVAASAVAMDKTLTKLVANSEGIAQASWLLVKRSQVERHLDAILDKIEQRFQYPVFVKPAGTGSSVGVSKAADRDATAKALSFAAEYDDKILVEEFIDGCEIEVAVMGNSTPVASICGEIDSGAEFYDYDAKYVTDTSVSYIPARIAEEISEMTRQNAIKIYSAMGCKGLSRVDFFVTRADNRIVFNEINTLPGFTSISMYPKLFCASGFTAEELVDELIRLALEADK